MDVKKLSVVVEQKGIAPTAKNLDSLAKAAEGAQKPLERLSSTLGSFKNVNLDKLSGNLQDTTQAIKDVKASTSGLADMAKNIGGLSVNLTNIANATERLSAKTADVAAYVVQLRAMRTELEGMKGLSGNMARNSTGGSGGGSGSSRSASVEPEIKAQQRLAQQIERTAMMAGRTKSEYLTLRAAQQGLSDSMVPHLARIKQYETNTNGATMSTKAYNAALRMVPAQFTDIATQLAGGQNPMLILMQQGGQLKDMFGGVGMAIKAAGSYLLSLAKNPLVLAAAAIAAMGYTIYSVTKELGDFNKANVVSNGILGLSTQGFYDMRDAIAATGASKSKASAALTEIAKNGEITADRVKEVGIATTKMSQAAGISISEAVGYFADLRDKPLETLDKLNKSYNFLEYNTRQAIKALAEQGDTAGATALATDTLKKAIDTMSKEAKDNLEGVEWLFKKIKNAADWAIESIRGLATNTDTQKIASLSDAIKKLEASQSDSSISDKSGLQTSIDSLKAQKKAIEDKSAAESDAAKKRGEEVAAEKAKNNAREVWDKTIDSSSKLQINKKKEIAKVEAEYQSLVRTGIATAEDEIAKKEKLNAIEKKYKVSPDRSSERAQHKTDARELEKNSIVSSIEALKEEAKALEESGLAYDKVSQHAKNAAKWRLQAADPKVSGGAKDKATENAALEDQAAALEIINKQTVANLKAAESYGDVSRKNAQDIADLNEQYDQEAKYISMTTKEKNAAQALYSNEVAMNKELLELEKKRNNIKVGSAEEAYLNASIEYTRNAYATKAELINANLVLQQKELSWTENLSVSAKQYSDNLGTYNSQVQNGFMTVFSTVESALENFVSGTKSSFKDLAVSVLKQIAVMLAKIALMKVAMAAVGLLGSFGTASGTGAGTAEAGSLFGAPLASAKGNAFTGSSVAKFAKGSAFTNSVVSGATPIKFASGGAFNNGVIGEAGPEAVMPLTRTANGNLGVETSGTGGTQNNVSVNITMNGDGSSASTTESSDSTSAKALGLLIAHKAKEVIANEQRPGGLLARA